MTSSEVKSSDNATYTVPKKTGTDTVTRKASFKCSTPNRVASQRIATRKVVVPLSTVQALTFKFNELSQLAEGHGKQRLNQKAVKTFLGSGGKSNTIKVVICRKPSTPKHKRSDDLIIRRKINVRRFQPSENPVAATEKQDKVNVSVHKKISEFEEKETREMTRSSNVNTSMAGKTHGAKFLVDIDLNEENEWVGQQKVGEKRNRVTVDGENSLSVRTAIHLFEQNSKNTEKNSAVRQNKTSNASQGKTDGRERKEVSEVKSKPIAAIKPILKKPTEDKSGRKTKLLPKDSLNRKKYLMMKRELGRTGPSRENSDEETHSGSEEGNSKGKSKDLAESQVASDVKWRECDTKVKNNSSLHGQIRDSGLVVVVNEILLNEEKSPPAKAKQTTEVPNGNQNLKPNPSFLWSKKEDVVVYGEKKPINRMDLPLPVPPENFIPTVADTTDETIYDDVLPPPSRPETEGDNSEKRESVNDSDTYDDVGVYWENKQNATASNKSGGRFEDWQVREKNHLNKMSGTGGKSSEKCGSYLYDDGEGEKYQYISDGCDHVGDASKGNDLDIYQYIQSNKDESNNIYEDIQSIRSQMTTKDRVKDIYEDVNCIGNSGADADYGNNCYESVYNGIYSGNREPQGYAKSDQSDTSNNSGRSTYEKSNSLYGMSGENAAGNENLLGMGDRKDSTESPGYHVTLYASGCSNSETSQSNSDEWVEVSETESEGTVYLVHERPRRIKVGNSFPQKEKRRWKRLQRKSNMSSDESKLQNDDHFYESVGQYENAEIIQEAARILEAEQANNYNNREQFYNNEQFIDDFDSQSSEDEAYVDAKLPDIPNHGYNLTKSLKAAGKKLRKNFSIRKSDFSKSLKRFKKGSRPKGTETTVLGLDKEVEIESVPKPECPSTPTNLSNSIYSNNSDSSSSSHNVSKSSSSSNDLKGQRHRKSWTFRSKFKSNSIEAAESVSSLDTSRNSTFYLSLNEAQPKKMDKKNELLSEIQSVLSKRNSNSTENVSDKTDRDVVAAAAPLRNPDSGTTPSTKFRPSVPPPPPPGKTEATTIEKTKYSDILWGEKATNNCLYVESGLFDKQKKHSRCTDSDTSLYAEIGLYAASDELNAKKAPMFVDEPLYQFYTECVNQRARDDILNNYDSEGYEEINDYYSVINEKRRTIDIKNVRPNFEDFNEDVRSKISSLKSISDRRTLWCQIPAVVDSCILQSMSDQARKLQEAKFEIITSEGSYMNSLNVLENHFMKKVSDLNIITKRDFRILFSNIVSVKKCSESFLEDLENCWQNNIMLNGICEIVHKHSLTSFQVYTKYCKNQVCIYRTLRELLDKNWNFENALKEIESDPICQNLNIHSFLMLPMQRITRLPLLLGAVLARMDKSDDEYEICKASFDVLNKIVQDCDDEARRMEKCEEMLILSQQIEFPKDIRRIPIITGSRFLVKHGQVTQLVNRDENKLTFGKKFSKVTLTLFLFTDLLILAKKKNPRSYVVVDHCPRNLVQMQTTDGLTQLPVKLNANSDLGGKLLMLLTMLENHEKKTVEMILSFEMESDRQRWLDAVTPKLSENPNECIYEEWDCPQVIALYEFTPVQPDELSLCIGDVVNVLKKMSDGWYQGERLRDGARGWFPQNHTQEVSSSHIRAKNKKLRYKLLALSGNLIDSQKANGK